MAQPRRLGNVVGGSAGTWEVSGVGEPLFTKFTGGVGNVGCQLKMTTASTSYRAYRLSLESKFTQDCTIRRRLKLFGVNRT